MASSNDSIWLGPVAARPVRPFLPSCDGEASGLRLSALFGIGVFFFTVITGPKAWRRSQYALIPDPPFACKGYRAANVGKRSFPSPVFPSPVWRLSHNAHGALYSVSMKPAVVFLMSICAFAAAPTTDIKVDQV